MENNQNFEETKSHEQHENINEVQNPNIQQQENTRQVDFLPNQTLYINNLNEKIKSDGKFYKILKILFIIFVLKKRKILNLFLKFYCR